MVIALLGQPNGTTIAAIMKATVGSSTRCAAPLQASRRKKLGLTLPPNPCPGAQLSRQANAAEADLARYLIHHQRPA